MFRFSVIFFIFSLLRADTLPEGDSIICNIQDLHFWTVFQLYFGNTTSLNIRVIENKNHVNTDDFLTGLLQNLYHHNFISSTLKIRKHQLNSEKEATYMKIKYNYFDHFADVSFYLSSMSSNDFKELAMFEKRRRFTVENYFLVISWNHHDLQEYINKELRTFSVPRSGYMVVLISPEEPNEENLDNMFRLLWKKYGIYNMILVKLCSPTKNFYVFDPFSFDEKWGKTTSFALQTEKFDVNILRNNLRAFNGFPLPVSLFTRIPTVLKPIPEPLKHIGIYKILSKYASYAGQDGIVMANVAEFLNFVPELKVPPSDNVYGVQFPNGTSTGSLGDVIQKNVAISFNGRFISDLGTNETEFTTPVGNDMLCVIVPSAQKIPQWLKIFRCFTPDAWLGIFAVYFLAVLYWYSIKPVNFQSDSRKSRSCFSTFQIYSFMVSASVKFPHLDSQRVFFASCMFFSIIITGTFQGSLVTSYTTTSYYRNINSLQQLDESGLRIGTASMGLADVFVNDSSLGRSLKSKVVIINSNNTMHRAAYQKDLAVLERKEDAKMRIKLEFTQQDGFELVHLVKECPRSYYLSYIVARGIYNNYKIVK